MHGGMLLQLQDVVGYLSCEHKWFITLYMHVQAALLDLNCTYNFNAELMKGSDSSDYTELNTYWRWRVSKWILLCWLNINKGVSLSPTTRRLNPFLVFPPNSLSRPSVPFPSSLYRLHSVLSSPTWPSSGRPSMMRGAGWYEPHFKEPGLKPSRRTFCCAWRGNSLSKCALKSAFLILLPHILLTLWPPHIYHI